MEYSWNNSRYFQKDTTAVSYYEMNLEWAGLNMLALTVVDSPPDDLIFQVIDN